ncbi:MAG TPA: pilus assembly protein TadG-related protein [Candidatus Limnocylindria bacterium]
MTALTTIALLPLLLIVLSTTLELGALRVVAARARSAADLAALVAVNDQDDGELERTGRLRPAADASDVARAMFAANLEPIAGTLAESPSAIAADAVVVIEDAPATVRLTANVPVRTPVFGALLFKPVTDITVRASGSAR